MRNSIPAFVTFLILSCTAAAQIQLPGLRIQDRFLTTPCGDTVMLRGVNKMAVWTNDLVLRKQTYAEIKKTGANCVRIVWLAQPSISETDAGPEGMDRTIQDAIDAGLIPIVELHDATGDWSRLNVCLSYWIRSDVRTVIHKHEKYMVLNFANEAGDETVSDQAYIDGYKDAVSRLRVNGIFVPVMIDAADWGKNLEQIVRCAPQILLSDPIRNLLFSVHTYWAIKDGATPAFITNQLETAVIANIPFVVGEFTYLFNQGQTCTTECSYETILEQCQRLRIGWMAWEWGPGNEYADPSCFVMNMTTSSYAADLQAGWATTVVDGPQGIRKTSTTPAYILNKGVCDPTSVAGSEVAFSVIGKVFPNPSTGDAHLMIWSADANDVTVEIISITGTTIVSPQVFAVHAGMNTIPVNTPMQGLQFCVVRSQGHVNTVPMLVVR